MEGVQFLLKDPVYVTEYSWGFSWAGLILLGFVIITLICFYDMFKSKDSTGIIPLTILFIVCVFFSYAAFSTGTETEVYSHAEYQVTISEDVKLKEFMENYEIVDVKGEIYTIVIKSELEGTKEIA
jgi:uncharacterized membrane protein